MRISGSLFTHTEMSASIADSTFLQVSGSILTSSNFCVTVQEAMNTLRIVPIVGSGLRHPFYDELISSGSIPAPISSSNLTYSFRNQSLNAEVPGWTFAILKSYNSNLSYIIYENSEVGTTSVTVESGSFLTVYMTYDLDSFPETNPCSDGYMTLNILRNGTPIYASNTCPAIISDPVAVGGGQIIKIEGQYSY